MGYFIYYIFIYKATITSYHGGKQRIGKKIAEIIYDESTAGCVYIYLRACTMTLKLL